MGLPVLVSTSRECSMVLEEATPSARLAPAQETQLSCVQAANVGVLGADQEDFLEEVPLQADDLEQSEGGQGTNIGGNGGQQPSTPLTSAQPKKRNTQSRGGQSPNTPLMGQYPWSQRVV